MSGVTSKAAIRYATLTDAPNAQTLSKNLADDLDNLVVPKYPSAAARNVANPSPSDGDCSYRTDLHSFEVYYASLGAWTALVRAPLFAYKVSDESVTSSTTLQDDNDLTFSVEASSVYIYELSLSYIGVSDGGTAAGGLKTAWSVPASSAGTRHVTGTHTTGSNIVPSDDNARNSSHGLTTVVGHATSATGGVVFDRGLLITSVTAGTFKLQWAQVTSNATATTIQGNSYAILRKMA